MNKELKQRAMKDEHDVLWEELESQLEQIRNAYKSGKLMLNSLVIQKSALYLNVDKYIDKVKDKSINKEVTQGKKSKVRTRKVGNVDMMKISENNLRVSEDFMFDVDKKRKEGNNQKFLINEESKTQYDKNSEISLIHSKQSLSRSINSTKIKFPSEEYKSSEISNLEIDQTIDASFGLNKLHTQNTFHIDQIKSEENNKFISKARSTNNIKI